MARQPSSDLGQKILKEAIGLVYREGLDQITMRRLAEKLGYSPATIYLHFKNKDDLVTQIAVFGFDRLAEATRAAVGIDDPVAGIHDSCRRYVEFGLTHRELYRLMFQELRATSPQHPEWEDAREVWRTFRLFYQRGMDRGIFRELDPDREIAIGWAMLHGFVQLAQSERLPLRPGDGTLSELCQQLVEQRTRALLA